MRINPIGSNMTELTTDTHIVLFSYSTPVAYEDKGTSKCYRTSKKWSRTTSKHINKWLDGRTYEEVEQKVCDRLTNVWTIPRIA